MDVQEGHFNTNIIHVILQIQSTKKIMFYAPPFGLKLLTSDLRFQSLLIQSLLSWLKKLLIPAVACHPWFRSLPFWTDLFQAHSARADLFSTSVLMTLLSFSRKFPPQDHFYDTVWFHQLPKKISDCLSTTSIGKTMFSIDQFPSTYEVWSQNPRGNWLEKPQTKLRENLYSPLLWMVLLQCQSCN